MIHCKHVPLLALSFSFYLAAGASSALGQDSQGKLPPGHYMYLGSEPGRSPAKRFIIDSNGAVSWEIDQPIAQVEPVNPGEKNGYESYNYPMVKWQTKLVSGNLGAAAQLTTTYEWGLIKYQITVGEAVTQNKSSLFKKASSKEDIQRIICKQGLIVELLDQNGFKLAEFHIPGNVFHPMAGTSLMEGRSAVPMPENIYRLARDLTLR